MSEVVGIEMCGKRITNRQKHRPNPSTHLNIEDFYKVTVFIPYLDYFINQLQERFLSHSEIFEG